MNQGLETPGLAGERQDTAAQIEKFFHQLDGKTIFNANNVPIRIVIKNHGSADWSMYFESYSNYETKDHGDNLNYVDFTTYPETSEISIMFAELRDPNLSGQNIFPQIIKLIGQYLPDNFKLSAGIVQTTSERKTLKAKTDYLEGKIDIAKLKETIQNLLMTQISIQAGFNKFSISFTNGIANGHSTPYVHVIAEKDPELKTVKITIPEFEKTLT